MNQHEHEITVTLDLELPEDRIAPEELELIEAHMGDLLSSRQYRRQKEL